MSEQKTDVKKIIALKKGWLENRENCGRNENGAW